MSQAFAAVMDLLSSGFTSTGRLYHLGGEGPLGELLVEAWCQREALNTPWRLELFGAPIPMTDGWVDIPTGPGLGFDVDESFVRRRAKEVRVAMAGA